MVFTNLFRPAQSFTNLVQACLQICLGLRMAVDKEHAANHMKSLIINKVRGYRIRRKNKFFYDHNRIEDFYKSMQSIESMFKEYCVCIESLHLERIKTLQYKITNLKNELYFKNKQIDELKEFSEFYEMREFMKEIKDFKERKEANKNSWLIDWLPNWLLAWLRA